MTNDKMKVHPGIMVIIALIKFSGNNTKQVGYFAFA